MIDGFNVFLPPGYQITPDREECATSVRLRAFTPHQQTMNFSIPNDKPTLCRMFGIPTDEGQLSTASPQNTHVAEELHNGVSAFDEGDSSIEPVILAKPLNELLAESGYSVATPPSEDGSHPLPTTSGEVPSQPPPVDSSRATNSSSSRDHTTTQEAGASSSSTATHEANTQTRSTRLQDISTTEFPVLGQTILYSIEHLLHLDMVDRMTLSKKLNTRFKELLSYGQNILGPHSPHLRQAAVDGEPISSPAPGESAAVLSEIHGIRKLIIQLLDISIVVDRLEIVRRKELAKNAARLLSSFSEEVPSKSSSTSASASASHSDPSSADETPDPTLPQNRPTTIASSPLPTIFPNPSSILQQPASPRQLPTKARLQLLARIDENERRDKERGGPGRLSFEEFEEIMKGEKGRKLGFVGAWIDMASF